MMDTTTLIGYTIAVLTICSYLIFPNVYIKPVPIWIFCGCLFFTSDSRSFVTNSIHKQSRTISATISKRLTAIALFASSFGDIALEIFDDDGKKEDSLFIGGLLCFLIAHIIYCVAFWQSTRKLSILLTFPAVILYSGMMVVLVPHLQEHLVIPVLVYGFVISSMMYLATNRYVYPIQNQPPSIQTSIALTFFGSFSFVASDIILSLNQFVLPVPNGKFIVMITYYFAQFLIALSASLN